MKLLARTPKNLEKPWYPVLLVKIFVMGNNRTKLLCG